MNLSSLMSLLFHFSFTSLLIIYKFKLFYHAFLSPLFVPKKGFIDFGLVFLGTLYPFSF